MFITNKDCKTYVTQGNCEEQKCEGRHRRYCTTKHNTSGCYRGDTCQYLHSSSKKEEMNNLSKRTECDKDMQEILRCNHCDFKTQQKVTLQKHITLNIKKVPTLNQYPHLYTVSTWTNLHMNIETILNDMASTEKKACYVERMINRYGSYFIMKNMGYQEDCSSDGLF